MTLGPLTAADRDYNMELKGALFPQKKQKKNPNIIKTLQKGQLKPRFYNTSSMDSRSIILMDCGMLIMIYIGLNVAPSILETVFGVKSTSELVDYIYGLPNISSAESSTVKRFLNKLNGILVQPSHNSINDWSTIAANLVYRIMKKKGKNNNRAKVSQLLNERLMIETDWLWRISRPTHASFQFMETTFPTVKKREKCLGDSLIVDIVSPLEAVAPKAGTLWDPDGKTCPRRPKPIRRVLAVKPELCMPTSLASRAGRASSTFGGGSAITTSSTDSASISISTLTSNDKSPFTTESNESPFSLSVRLRPGSTVLTTKSYVLKNM
uniref:Uncharacterized protein n=1 Tax=Glossina pallidipes TaxID=7398 RepID=A0A1B0AE85_GLOPL